MKVLVLGASGMLGHRLYQRLMETPQLQGYGSLRTSPETIPFREPFDRSGLHFPVDAEQPESVRSLLQLLRPDVVVNAIGVVKSLNQANPARMIAINALFPHQLHAYCQDIDARLIHISTDCVFSGEKGMYSEQDRCDAYDVYGLSKHLGEVTGENSLTLRTSMIGSELGRAHGLLEWFLGQRGERIDGYTKAVFSGFTTQRLAEIILWVVTEHPKLSGLYHVSAPPIDKYDLLTRIRDALSLDIDIKPSEKLVIDRSLDCQAFTAQTGFQQPNWDDMIAELAADLKPTL